MSEQNKPQGTPGTQGSGGQKKAGGLISGILAVLVALLVVALVFAGVFTFFLKNNLFGLGEQFRERFQPNPILRLALPPAPPDVDPDAPHNLTQDELLAKYEAYRKQVASLQAALDASNTSLAAITAENLSKAAIEADLQSGVDARKAESAALAQQKAELEAIALKVGEAAAKGDTAGFKAYFEKLEPATAEALYKQILSGEAADASAKQTARPFELMDRAKAASVFKEIWTKDKNLLLTIVDANKPQTLAEILAEMEATIAADITRSLADFRKAKSAASASAASVSP